MRIFSNKIIDCESELLNLKEVDWFIILNNNSNFIILFGKYEEYQKEIKKIFKLLKDEESDYYETMKFFLDCSLQDLSVMQKKCIESFTVFNISTTAKKYNNLYLDLINSVWKKSR